MDLLSSNILEIKSDHVCGFDLEDLITGIFNEDVEEKVRQGLIDRILCEFIGDKSIRLLSRGPNDGSRAMMRSVINDCVKSQATIPVLIPASACKLPLHGQKADIAEVLFIRMLRELQYRICSIYPPGFKFIIRLEDLTLMTLFPESRDIHDNTQEYIKTFRHMLTLMKADHFITLRPESSLMATYHFFIKHQEITQLFGNYINATDLLRNSVFKDNKSCNHNHDEMPVFNDTENDEELAKKSGGIASESLTILQSLGWLRGVSFQMRDWLRETYKKRFPSLSQLDHDCTMFRFLSCILVRKLLNGIGLNESEAPFGRLEIGLIPPLPDTPEFSTRAYYRSCPLTLTKSKAPFWRCCGVIRHRKENHSQLSDIHQQLEFTVVEIDCDNKRENTDSRVSSCSIVHDETHSQSHQTNDIITLAFKCTLDMPVAFHN